MELFHDIPESQGVVNCLKRAKQMLNVRWTPIRPVPQGFAYRAPDDTEHYQDVMGPAYMPQTGVNYSSVRIHEKFVGFNVSLETYVSSLANPNGVMYTRSQHGKGLRMYSFYGTVCSNFVSYVTDRPYRTQCSAWPSLPDVTEIPKDDPDKLKLCDIVLNPKKHITIVTDIARDVEGHVRTVDITESVLPLVRCVTYTVEELRHLYLENGYNIYRYAGIHRATYTPTPFSPVEGDPYCGEAAVNRSLMTDFGNRANYQIGEEPVEITVLEDGWEAVEVDGADGVRVYPLTGGPVVIRPSRRGFYTARCIRGGVKSEPVEWCAVDSFVRTDKEEYAPGETVTITFGTEMRNDDVFCYVLNNETNNIRGQGYFTEEEKAAGTAKVRKDVRFEKPGDYWIIAISHGKYGMYASKRCCFRVR